MKKIFKFFYYFDDNEDEQEIEIEAENEEQATLKFYDEVGIAEFGCIYEKSYFVDNKYPQLKEKILRGC
jgi:hypothetical protein